MCDLFQLARDVKNAFVHARSPSCPTCIIPDTAIKEYYEWKNKQTLPDEYTFSLIVMLQGHHEALPAWKEFITNKLTTLFNFKPISYKPALSIAIINIHKVYLAHQVDDFHFAFTNL